MPAEGTEFVSLAQLKDYDTNRVAAGLGLKLNAPASAGTDGQMLVYGASGNQWADVPEDTAYSADDETLQLSGTQFSVKDGGITAAKIASGTITADKMASGVIPDVSGFATQTQVNEISDTVATTKWLKPANDISAGTDLDTLTEPGSWFCDDSTSVTNVPGGVAAEFLLYVYSGGGVVAHELHTPFGTWWRWKREDASSWDVWIRVLAPDGPLPLKDGGTGATAAAEALENLGVYAECGEVLWNGSIAKGGTLTIPRANEYGVMAVSYAGHAPVGLAMHFISTVGLHMITGFAESSESGGLASRGLDFRSDDGITWTLHDAYILSTWGSGTNVQQQAIDTTETNTLTIWGIVPSQVTQRVSTS